MNTIEQAREVSASLHLHIAANGDTVLLEKAVDAIDALLLEVLDRDIMIKGHRIKHDELRAELASIIEKNAPEIAKVNVYIARLEAENAALLAASREWEAMYHEVCAKADDELAALKSQQPVAWAMKREDGLVLDVICPDEHDSHEGEYTVPLFLAAGAQPVQQEKCYCDERGIGEPGVSCGDCPTRDYAAPVQAVVKESLTTQERKPPAKKSKRCQHHVLFTEYCQECDEAEGGDQVRQL